MECQWSGDLVWKREEHSTTWTFAGRVGTKEGCNKKVWVANFQIRQQEFNEARHKTEGQKDIERKLHNFVQ